METIFENFKFLILEAENQIKLTYGLLADYSPDLLEKIASKDDYIDTLKNTVENACFSEIHSAGMMDKKRVNDIRAVHIMAVNLERIADYCVNIARQTHYLSDVAFIHQFAYQNMFTEIQKALSRISSVFDRQDLSGALDICRAEFSLDRLYKVNFDVIMDSLKKGRQVTDLVTVIFIFRYLERIGDSILNIGEALLFSIIGDRIKIRQFDALQKTLSQSEFDGMIADIDFNAIWGSRSGCRISRVGRKNPAGFKSQGIFKEGVITKIRRERENIDHWEDVFPGLAPRIFGYHEEQETASLLVEYLPGCTLDQVTLTESSDVIRNVMFIFEQTLLDVWTRTRRPCPVQTDYIPQLLSRMEAVLRVHPDCERPSQRIEFLAVESSRKMMAHCREIEKEIPAPFSVFVHGDFNTNNVVYNHADQKIHYIDLYRSRDADYVQDASVFLVSNFRLPVFDPELRERLNTVMLYFYEVFQDFAQKNDDRTFPVRLAMAAARSLFTSARFELNRAFAKGMFLRSHYLMERILDHRGKPWEEFAFPETVLFY